KGSDIQEIKRATERLTEAVYKLSAAIYEKTGSTGTSAGYQAGDAAGPGSGPQMDAAFRVKDDKEVWRDASPGGGPLDSPPPVTCSGAGQMIISKEQGGWTDWPSATITRSWAFPATPRRPRSRRPFGNSPASTTRTPTRTTPMRPRSSRRSTRPIRSSPTRKSGPAMTSSATRPRRWAEPAATPSKASAASAISGDSAT